jgi:hypothetical protein
MDDDDEEEEDNDESLAASINDWYLRQIIFYN